MQLFSQNQIQSFQSGHFNQYCSILQSYYHLSEDLNRMNSQNQNLQKQIEEVERKTLQINSLILKEQKQKNEHFDSIHRKIFGNETNKQEKQEKSIGVCNSISQKSSQKRVRKPSERRYRCPYDHCARYYDTSVSLNLHLKLKHNAGTKKQRQQLADSIIMAEQKGQQPPKSSIELPPLFLEEYRTKKQFKLKYSM